MASLDSLRTRYYASEGKVVRRLDDQPVAIRLYYKGGGTVTSVTVDNTAEDYELITSNGGTDTYTVAAYATVGALADAINADGIFEARVMDALRSDSTDDTMIDGAITAGTDEDGNVVWDVKVDTSAALAATVTLSPKSRKDFKPGHRVHLQEIQYNENVSAAEANAVRVYLRRGTTETQIWGAASVDATLTTINFANGVGKISGGPDDELIVRVQDATSLTNAAGNFLQVVGTYE